MKKICVLLLLAFCMSFCPVVSAANNSEILQSKDIAYINGTLMVNYDYYSDVMEVDATDRFIPNGFSSSSYFVFDDFSFSWEYSSSDSAFNFAITSDGETKTSQYKIESKHSNVLYCGFVYDISSSASISFYAINYNTKLEYYYVVYYSVVDFHYDFDDADISEPTLTMSLGNVSDPLTDDFYVEVVNGYSSDGYIKTQYQSNSDDSYTSVKELHVPANATTRFTAKELNVTKAGIYTFSLYDPDSYLKGIQILEITSDYVAPDDGSGGGSDDDTDEDLFNFTELPEDANVLDYIKWICTNMIELFKGLGRCIKNFVTQTKEMSSILTKFFSFMPTEFTLILTLGMMFLVLLRFLGR